MKRNAIALALLVMIASVSSALDIDAASGRFGIAIINNQSGVPVTPPPVASTLGGSLVVSFAKDFFLTVQPGLDFYWTTYEWADGRAVPTQDETGRGNNAFVLGFLLDLPVTATFRFSDRVGAAASLGAAFLLRASFANDSTATYADTMTSNLSSIVSYFWSAGRWFYPSASARFDIYLQNNFTFTFGARGFLPVFNAWTGNANFWDEGILQITMSMIVGI